MKKKEYKQPEAKAIAIMPVRILEGSSPVAIDTSEEGEQSGAESLDLDFD
ncbi:MAG: hypothetical protein IJV10_00775 [Prevotella sp.]|nr:hypothetical protein [Prevotella sp.]